MAEAVRNNQIQVELSIRNNLGSCRNVVINPLCVVDIEPYTTMRQVLTKSAILNPKRVLIIQNRMEEIVVIELRPVVAGVTVTKRVPARSNLILPQHGRR